MCALSDGENAPLTAQARSDSRQRKTRCDPTLPRCEPCERTNALCEYFDSTKNKCLPRAYITSLQDRVKQLNEELKALDNEDDYEPDHETMAREAGLVKFSDNEESRFLGPSSGIAITRFVMQFAKQNASRRAIKAVVSHHAAAEIKHKFDVESHKPTSKVYPLISSVAAPDLPNRDLMDKLVDIYMVKAQYMLPLLHEPTFRTDLEAVYGGSKDPTLNFQVRLVVAISMQKLDTQYAGLADSYYLAALPFLTDAVRKRDLSTLQCFAMIAQYSLLTPTRTAAYWVVGMAAKLCQELGLCEEETIDKPPSGARPNFLEIDMRRRLFWIITSMEYGLSHSLGRPSAFGATVDNLNVRFFELCDDRFITPDGLALGHHPIMKKCIAVHFLKMRLLQAEIRRTLYLRKRATPTDEQDPWFHDILRRIDEWVSNCPKNDEGSGLSEAWFHGRRNTMIIFIFRPSPQIPTPSFDAALRCYDAAVFNIHLQKRQVEAKLIDITWIFAQAINMALNTVLWCISYPGLRQLHPLEEVHDHVHAALAAIELCADRWPGIRSAIQLYENLIQSCLKAYESDRVGESPYSDYVSSAAQDASSGASQVAQSPASTTNTSIFGPQSPQSIHSSHTVPSAPSHILKNGANGYVDHARHSPLLASGVPSAGSTQPTNAQYYTTTSPQLTAPAPTMHYSLPGFDVLNPSYVPTSTAGMTQWTPVTTASAVNTGYARSPEFAYNSQPWLASFGDEYSRYLNQAYGPPPDQMQSLSQQQQTELMSSLEQSQLPDVSNLVSDATTFYTVGLP
jgi:Fungal specific transcription factor domain